jgi:hypothetical protein
VVVILVVWLQGHIHNCFSSEDVDCEEGVLSPAEDNWGKQRNTVRGGLFCCPRQSSLRDLNLHAVSEFWSIVK